MDATSSTPTMAGGWDINSSRPGAPPQFTSTFDIKPPMVDTPLRSHLNVSLAPPAVLTHNLGDYLANHSHRLMVAANFGQHPMIGLRTADPGYVYMKDFVPRSEDIVSLFEHSRSSRRGEDDLAGPESPAGTSLSTPAVPDSRFHGDADTSISCLPQFSSRLLPMLTMDKNNLSTSNLDANAEEEKHAAENVDKHEEGGDNDGDDEEDEENDDGGGGEDDDDDDGASAWPAATPTSVSTASKGIIVIRQTASTRASSPIACQDCGNQAKKDCVHMRCRTCCKSRGLECPTHVKSTWVPAFKRRQRQQLFSNDIEQPIKILRSKSTRAIRHTPERGIASEAAHAANSHTSTSTGTPPSSDLNWLQQEGRLKRLLPAEIKEQAVFKCVKVTGMNDGQEEFAYQTIVKIGGHIYKGILYDQGVDKGQASTSSIAELRLGGRNAAASSSATVDLAGNLYGTSESVFLGGNNATQ